MARDPQRASGGLPLIPCAHITAWRARAPWPTDAQVEQDVLPLLRDGASYDVDAAGELVSVRLIARLRGEAWRGGTS